jgi:Rrf2 family protein
MRLELTRRSEYAIRACMRLAGSDRLLSGREIAASTDVPERFLARVLVELVKSGLIEAQLGRTGGYRLRRPPRALTLLELVEAIEGPSRSTRCVLRQRACDASHPCAIHPVWAAAQSGVIGVLAATTLADLVELDRAMDKTNLQAVLQERTA